MRLGRPLALTAAAVLALGIAAPAAAEGSNTAAENSKVTVTIDAVGNVSPTGTHTFTGAGCIKDGKPGTILLAIGPNEDHLAPGGQAMADAEGKWSVAADMTKAVNESKGDAKTDPWYVFAQCMFYGGQKSDVEAAAFVLTPIGGTVQATGEGAYTNFEVNATGFNPNTQVTLAFFPSDKDGKVAKDATGIEVGKATSDANGAVATNVGAPTAMADGYYVLKISGSNGEGAFFDSVFKAEGNQFVSATKAGSTTTPAPAPSEAPKPLPQEQAPAKNAAQITPKKELAKTGIEAPALAIFALGLTGVGAVALKRRHA
ncbi:Uncharacterised protein [Actinomyces bovis]|uniref:Gram-positive cocci surface proteins LPxTG domain-containing protein n=1 Tax=Actinomyces bovis TaxID=1658 RepID=A0ABY1VLS5_9ACTO|nr:hypothetical protein [Actinomyces bovis]SPT52702.1 Uncharacterised protein [Actinomyces bovis]VEG54648.1 Uncharacterised protein [Actinomyces israelii]